MIDQCLELAIGKLISEITYNGQLQNFRTTLETRKIYNNYQRNYIENQKIKEQLGADYQSQESDSQSDGIFGAMNKYQMKTMLKQNLIKQKFDPQKLSFIEPPSISVDSQHQKQHNNQSIVPNENIQNANVSYVSNLQGLNPIDQRNQVIDNNLKKKNWFALDFLIKQLEIIIQNKKKRKINQIKKDQEQNNFDENDLSDQCQSECQECQDI